MGNENFMTLDEESQNIIDSLYPVGKERWFKALILDRDKSLQSLRFDADTDLGYKITAIGIRDEYVPQIQAISDLQDDLYPFLCNALKEYDLDWVMQKFKAAKEELKERVIANQPIPQH